MPNDPFQRQNSIDTRQLMTQLIEAREQYSNYLRGVATGQRQPDFVERALLKTKCDETVCAWRAGHEACRSEKSPERQSPGGGTYEKKAGG